MIFPLILAMARRYPFTRGRMRFFLDVVQRGAIEERLAALPAAQRTRRGFEIHCNPHDFTSDWIKLWGEHERLTERFLLDAMKGGGTFLDLGANIGYFSLLIAHEFGERCGVIAFEPNPPIYELLVAGAAASRRVNALRLVPLAISDQPGELSFVVDARNTGHSHLAAPGEPGAARSVPVVVLDDWLAQNPPASPVRAVKLDVEGCELKALRGMARLLREQRPALVVEVIDEHLRQFGDTRAALEHFLSDVGYREPWAAEDGNLYFRSPRFVG